MVLWLRGSGLLFNRIIYKLAKADLPGSQLTPNKCVKEAVKASFREMSDEKALLAGAT